MKYKGKLGSKYSPLLGFFSHEVTGLPVSLSATDHCDILGQQAPARHRRLDLARQYSAPC